LLSYLKNIHHQLTDVQFYQKRSAEEFLGDFFEDILEKLSLNGLSLFLFDDSCQDLRHSFFRGEKSNRALVQSVFLQVYEKKEGFDSLDDYFKVDEDEWLMPLTRGQKTLGCIVIKTSGHQYQDFFHVLGGLLSYPLHQWFKSRKVHLLNPAKKNQRQTLFRPAGIIGNSKSMLQLYSYIEKVVEGSTTVLIQGESGVGKERVAKSIHYCGPRSKTPFICVNCAALPSELIESELFGYEKGAFTNALQTRIGRFEEANGGTLFLDEIGDLPLSAQVKLLRVLQERSIERLGSNQSRPINVRIIAATHQKLEELIEQGKFRADLYYRLNVYPIYVPALKERREDILLLADYFVEKFNFENKKNVRRISSSAIDMMMNYHWPGNVRELENCIERAVILSDNFVIQGADLPPSLQTSTHLGTDFSGDLEAYLNRVESDMIFDALKSNEGHIGKTALALGVTERKLGLRLKKFEIDTKRFKKQNLSSLYSP
jgi:transcriptional regulator with GAF, ATPase, and Fis domain